MPAFHSHNKHIILPKKNINKNAYYSPTIKSLRHGTTHQLICKDGAL